MDARFGQHGHTVYRLFQDRFEMFDVFGQLIETEILGDAVHAPGFRPGLERADHHLARVFLVVGPFIGHAQDRNLFQALDGFGDDVEVFAGMQRDIHA